MSILSDGARLRIGRLLGPIESTYWTKIDPGPPAPPKLRELTGLSHREAVEVVMNHLWILNSNDDEPIEGFASVLAELQSRTPDGATFGLTDPALDECTVVMEYAIWLNDGEPIEQGTIESYHRIPKVEEA